jgi:hypothetical protein
MLDMSQQAVSATFIKAIGSDCRKLLQTKISAADRKIGKNKKNHVEPFSPEKELSKLVAA